MSTLTPWLQTWQRKNAGLVSGFLTTRAYDSPSFISGIMGVVRMTRPLILINLSISVLVSIATVLDTRMPTGWVEIPHVHARIQPKRQDLERFGFDFGHKIGDHGLRMGRLGHSI